MAMEFSNTEAALIVMIPMIVTVVAFYIGFRLGLRQGFFKGKTEGVAESNKRIEFWCYETWW